MSETPYLSILTIPKTSGLVNETNNKCNLFVKHMQRLKVKITWFVK